MSEAIKTVIGEFKTLCPDIASTMVFRLDGETLATSEGTTPEQTHVLVAHLNGITHAECIGGIQSLSIQDVNTQLSISAVDDVYLANLSPRMADQKTVKSLTEVVLPTVIRLSLGPRPLIVEKNKPTDESLVESAALDAQNEHEIPEITEPKAPPDPEPLLPKTPATQFMVKKIGGLLVAADTVRIDGDVIDKWQRLYEGKKLVSVNVETLEGKTVTCKFKPLKDSKTTTKGIIQVPEKIIQTLQCEKGKLVMVSPVVE